MRQLENQLWRIATARPDAARSKRVNDAYERYMRNISGQKQFHRDNMEMQRAFARGDRREYQRRYAELVDRQYPRNIYMGLNGG